MCANSLCWQVLICCLWQFGWALVLAGDLRAAQRIAESHGWVRYLSVAVLKDGVCLMV